MNIFSLFLCASDITKLTNSSLNPSNFDNSSNRLTNKSIFFSSSSTTKVAIKSLNLIFDFDKWLNASSFVPVLKIISCISIKLC